MAIDHCIASGADLMVQVEGDMLLGPGTVAALVAAWEDVRDAGTELPWLCSHNHDWYHKITETRTIAGRLVGFARSGSEPFWCAPSPALAQHIELLPSTRPDLVLYLKELGAAVLLKPELQVQHMGAINSFYYPKFGPELVTYLNSDGTARQPYPWFDVDFTLPRDQYPALYMSWAKDLARRAPCQLPEFA